MVTAFVFFGWNVELLRRLMVPAARLLPLALYLTIPCILVAGVLSRHRARRPRPRAVLVGLSASIVAFLVPLFAGWETARSPYMMGGIAPLTDATLHLGGAKRLLFLGGVDDYVAKRPLNPALLAVRLAITGFDLRKALVLGAILLGVACFLLARTIARDLGVAAGVAAFAGVYSFGYPTVTTTMTEALGVTVGALSFAALWAAVREKRIGLAVTGVFLLAVAQGVRSGALLVLISVPIFLAWLFRASAHRLNWRALAMLGVAVVIGVEVNVAGALLTSGDVRSLTANGGYLLYGMATGHPAWDAANESWTRIWVDHPEVSLLSDPEKARFVNQMALRQIRADPALFVRTSLRSAWNYVGGIMGSVLSPIRSAVVRWAVAGAVVLVACVLAARRRREGRLVLVDLALFAGALFAIPVLLDPWTMKDVPRLIGLASVLFALVGLLRGGPARLPWPHVGLVLAGLVGCAATTPFIGAESFRVFAATVPFLIMPLALAAAALQQRLSAGRPSLPVRPESGVAGRWAAVVGVGVVGVGLVGAPIAAAAVDRPTVTPRSCPGGQPAMALIGGSAVTIVSSERQADRMGEISVGGMKATTPGYAHLFAPSPGSLPTTMVSAISETGDDRIAFMPGVVDVAGDSVLYLCGEDLREPMAIGVTRFFWPPPLTFAMVGGKPLDR